MNKKILVPFVIMMSLASVIAVGYTFKLFNFGFAISEPFIVGYAIPGVGANNWATTSEACTNVGLTYSSFTDTPINLTNAYPGDFKKICFKITSTATNNIPINITREGVAWNTLLRNVTLTAPAQILPGENVGTTLTYYVQNNANGNFDGTLRFERG